MPIVIKTTEQSCGNRLTHPPTSLWLQQSLARFMSNHKGRACTNTQYEDSHDPGNSLSNTFAAREEDLAVTISLSVPISISKCEKMLRNLKAIRLKWDMILNNSPNEDAGLIMLATQCNLIGMSAVSSLDRHPHDRSMHKFNPGDKFSIYRPKEAVVVMLGNSNTFGDDVQRSSFLMTGLTHVMNELNPAKLLNQVPHLQCVYRNEFRKENYRYPDILYSDQSNKDHAGYPSFHNILYTLCTTFADRLSNMTIGFRECLESAAHSWDQFIRFLRQTSFRGGDVIYLLSRTTMRRVKFLFEKPPTTVTV